MKKSFKLQQKLQKQRLRELGQGTNSDDEDDEDDEAGEDNEGGDVDHSNNPNMFGYINEDGMVSDRLYTVASLSSVSSVSSVSLFICV